jgi:hypothetical protein
MLGLIGFPALTPLWWARYIIMVIMLVLLLGAVWQHSHEEMNR